MPCSLVDVAGGRRWQCCACAKEARALERSSGATAARVLNALDRDACKRCGHTRCDMARPVAAPNMAAAVRVAMPKVRAALGELVSRQTGGRVVVALGRVMLPATANALERLEETIPEALEELARDAQAAALEELGQIDRALSGALRGKKKKRRRLR